MRITDSGKTKLNRQIIDTLTDITMVKNMENE